MKRTPRAVMPCVAAAVFAVACQAPRQTVTELSDSAPPSAPVIRFSDDGAGGPDIGRAALKVRKAGTLPLPEGMVAVSDAFVNDAPIVIGELAPGEHAVEILVAVTPSDERVAAARLRLRDDPVVKWQAAGAMPVDSGTGAFFNPALTARIDPPTGARLTSDLLAALKTSYRPTYSTAVVSRAGAVMVAFSTGFGDGSYPVYVGFSAIGQRAVVLVECEVLPWNASPVPRQSY